MIAAIGYNIYGRCEARIYPAGMEDRIDWKSHTPSELGDRFINYAPTDPASWEPSIVIATGLDGNKVLRLIETRHYIVRLENFEAERISLPHFQNEENKNLHLEHDKNTVRFQYVNYLGRSRMHFDAPQDVPPLLFEVVPDKIDYEDDYIALTESLAEVCAGLLLECSGSTSNVFRQSDNESRTLLEQFIFLRQFCYGQNLQALLESIKRNPDRALDREEELRPLGCGRPSGRFYTNPFSYSRDWTRVRGSGPHMPQKVAVTRKFDTLDTPANRFINYALHRFDTVCTTLIETLKSGKDAGAKQAECYNEAITIHGMLESIFSDRFWDDIGPMDIMPQNNQVLQKREGYSQIFHAFGMLDMALQLDWKGKDEVYEGESKNVALLYEYWLFFELYKIIKSIDGCETREVEDGAFLDTGNGVTISLKQGHPSCQAFSISKYGVKVNLYYNRSFGATEFQTTLYEGSYSRPFRPDYTLAIYPDTYDKGKDNGERAAVRDGAVRYLHFDAKYRIKDLTSLIGDEGTEEDQFDDDKIGSITNTYNRGDLLKMHTYNDAIRRTIGSYVLYPGSYSKNSTGNKQFQLYDEILPGVGAFSIKPSVEGRGESELRDFILSVIQSENATDSRMNRMKYYSDIVLNEPATHVGAETGSPNSTTMRAGDTCVVGYIRNDRPNDYYRYLNEGGFLHNGREFLFYFYAIKGTDVYSHHKDIFRATMFRFYTNDIHETGTYKVEPVLCKICSNQLMSKADLVSDLQARGYATSENEHHADFYYVLTVRVIDESFGGAEYSTTEINQQNGNDTFSPHSPKVVICADW